MPEMNEISLQFSVDTSEINKLSEDAEKASESINRVGESSSTFNQLNQELISTAKNVNDLSNNSTSFADSLSSIAELIKLAFDFTTTSITDIALIFSEIGSRISQAIFDEITRTYQETEEFLFNITRLAYVLNPVIHQILNNFNVFGPIVFILRQQIAQLIDIILSTNLTHLIEGIRATGGVVSALRTGLAALVSSPVGKFSVIGLSLTGIAAGILAIIDNWEAMRLNLPIIMDEEAEDSTFLKAVEKYNEKLREAQEEQERFQESIKNFNSQLNIGAVFGETTSGDIKSVTNELVRQFEQFENFEPLFENYEDSFRTFGAGALPLVVEGLDEMLGVLQDVQEVQGQIPPTQLSIEFKGIVGETDSGEIIDIAEALQKEQAQFEKFQPVIKNLDTSMRAFGAGGLPLVSEGLRDLLNIMDQVRTGNIEIPGGGIANDETAENFKNVSEQVHNAEGALNNFNSALAKNTNNVADNETAITGLARTTREWTSEELEAAGNKLIEVNNTLAKFGLTPEINLPSGQEFDEMVEGVERGTEASKGILDEFGVYAANVVANISQNFGDLIFETLKGNFDSLGDFWDATMDSILKSFSDLVAGILSKPIIYLIKPKVENAEGGGQQGGTKMQLGGIIDGFKNIGKGISKIPGVSNLIDGVKGLFAEGGLLGGIGKAIAGIASTVFKAIPVVGQILAIAIPVFQILKGFFKKKPRLDLDFDSIKTEAGRRAAFVKEILDEDFFVDEIAQISVKRKAGLGVGGDDKIKQILQETLEQAADNVLEIINRLPSDMAETLREQLSNTQLDIDTVIKGERFLEFDAKGKEIKKKFEQFINGELQAKFLFAIDDFLQTAFESLGVLPEAASEFLAGRLEDFKNTSSREERAQVGQELLEDFSAFVDAFNIIEGNAGDSITAAINSVKSLADTLGFDGVPSLEEFNARLRELLNNVELDASTVQDFVELRNAIIALRSEIVDSVINILGVVDQLNSTIVSIGGTAVDTTGYMNQAIDSIQGALEGGGLSLSEREGLLGQLNSLATGLLQAEQAAAQAAAEARAQAQRRGIESRIAGLEREKKLIEENFDTRLEALQEELRLAEEFASLTESIRETLRSIVFSAESVFTTVEQINMLQGELAGLQTELASTNDPERQIELARRMEDAFKTLFDLAGDAFGVNSPEFVAIFEQVTGGLSSLAEFTENASRSVEEINAEIERLNAERNVMLEGIDLRIETLREQLSAIGSQNVQATFQASERVQALFEFMRNEAIAILEERLAQLEELEAAGIKTEIEGLQRISDLSQEMVNIDQQIVEIDQAQLTVLKEIKGALTNVPVFHGGGIMQNAGLARLSAGEMVLTPRQQAALAGNREKESGDITIINNFEIKSTTKGSDKVLPREIEKAIERSMRVGMLRNTVQEVSHKRLN